MGLENQDFSVIFVNSVNYFLKRLIFDYFYLSLNDQSENQLLKVCLPLSALLMSDHLYLVPS